MTSRAGRTNRSRSLRVRPAGGFTLIELFLAIALLCLIAVLTAVGLANWSRGTHFEQGVARLEAGLRMARAQSGVAGRRICLQVDPSTGSLTVLHEAQGLDEPGVFTDYNCSWKADVQDLPLRVVSVRPLGESAYADAWRSEASSGEHGPRIMFTPGGQCDGVEMELAPLDEADGRRAILTLSSCGDVSSRVMTAGEFQEFTDAQGGR